MYKEKIEKLIEKENIQLDDIEFIDDIIVNFKKYIFFLQDTNTFPFLFKNILSKDDYNDKIIQKDKTRTFAHNKAIDGMRQINRLCEIYDCEKIFDLDLENRKKVKEEIEKFLFEFSQY